MVLAIAVHPGKQIGTSGACALWLLRVYHASA
jgi:hypothetical protein